MSEDEDVKEPDNGGYLYLSINYDQNQEKSYKFSENGAIDDLSKVYFVNAKSGLNVRDNNSLDGNKILCATFNKIRNLLWDCFKI